jgi:Na+-translocating ferredoxin:NAD+ oxidoreductase RNF subunit RnfB
MSPGKVLAMSSETRGLGSANAIELHASAAIMHVNGRTAVFAICYSSKNFQIAVDLERVTPPQPGSNLEMGCGYRGCAEIAQCG